VEEVGGARDARVVVAHGLLAARGEQVGVEVEPAFDHRLRSASMVNWFCDVGGMIRAEAMVTSPATS